MFSNTFKVSRLKVAIATVAFGALLVIPAAASDSEMGVTVTGGSLTNSLSTTEDLPGVNYSFDPQSTSGVLTVGVQDTTGSDNGWTASLTSGDFVSTGDAPDIAASNLEITGQGEVTDHSGLNNSGDVSPVDFTTPANIATETQIASAAVGGGAGDFSWDANMTLNIPAGQQADTYTGTITLTTAQQTIE